MSDQEILTKAIQKAQKNGYRYILNYDDENDKHYVKILDLHKYFAVIFDHSFAKAFFGTKVTELTDRGSQDYSMMGLLGVDPVDVVTVSEGWEHHIQEMALCAEPLQYIKYYLDN